MARLMLISEGRVAYIGPAKGAIPFFTQYYYYYYYYCYYYHYHHHHQHNHHHHSAVGTLSLQTITQLITSSKPLPLNPLRKKNLERDVMCVCMFVCIYYYLCFYMYIFVCLLVFFIPVLLFECIPNPYNLHFHHHHHNHHHHHSCPFHHRYLYHLPHFIQQIFPPSHHQPSPLHLLPLIATLSHQHYYYHIPPSPQSPTSQYHPTLPHPNTTPQNLTHLKDDLR